MFISFGKCEFYEWKKTNFLLEKYSQNKYKYNTSNCLLLYTCTWTHTYTHTHTHTHKNIYTHTYSSIHTHTHTCKRTFINILMENKTASFWICRYIYSRWNVEVIYLDYYKWSHKQIDMHSCFKIRVISTILRFNTRTLSGKIEIFLYHVAILYNECIYIYIYIYIYIIYIYIYIYIYTHTRVHIHTDKKFLSL